MARRESDPVLERLDAILSVVQDLLVLESAKAGLRRQDIRRFLPVDNNRISKITRNLKEPK
jgi:hypothetical protein